MSILVTGGAGFVGGHVVRALAAGGDQVAVLDDLSSGSLDNVPAGVHVEVADIVDPSTPVRISALGPEVIIHAAAQVSVGASMLDPLHDKAVNLDGTLRVLEGARRAGSRRVVFVSTGGAIYGETTSGREHHRPRPKSYYGVHKYAAERYVEMSGLSHAIARLANVYGPGQRADQEGGVVAIFAEALTNGHPVTIYGNGRQRRDFIHVQDVAEALLLMARSGREGLWNVGTGVATSVNELLSAMVAEFGEPAGVEWAPPRPGEIEASCLGVERIQDELGWSATTGLDAGLRLLRREISPATVERVGVDRR